MLIVIIGRGEAMSKEMEMAAAMGKDTVGASGARTAQQT